MDEILLENVILCKGCHHDDHAEGQCAAPNTYGLQMVYDIDHCMCGQRLTGTKAPRINSPPTGGTIGDYPTVRGDRR